MIDHCHNALLRAAMRERRATADRIAHAILLGIAFGCGMGAVLTLAVMELAR